MYLEDTPNRQETGAGTVENTETGAVVQQRDQLRLVIVGEPQALLRPYLRYRAGVSDARVTRLKSNRCEVKSAQFSRKQIRGLLESKLPSNFTIVEEAF